MNVQDIRNEFLKKYEAEDFVIDKTGSKTIELINVSFEADEDYIVRKPNMPYLEKELKWYLSESRNVNDIEDTPKIWRDVASKYGQINSNYGWCIFSEENYNQYMHVLLELQKNPNSRRAVMLYNRPSMHIDFKSEGMNDFICTYGQQFFIRDDKLVSNYIMRSNDAVFGYNNDVAWAKYVHNKLAKHLRIEVGAVNWYAASLHIYSRHFKFLKEL